MIKCSIEQKSTNKIEKSINKKSTLKDELNVKNFINEVGNINKKIHNKNKGNLNDLHNLGSQYNDKEDSSDNNEPFMSIFQVDNILSRKSIDKALKTNSKSQD